MSLRAPWQYVALRLRREDGYTLIELLVVLVVMGIVLGALVAAFATGMNQTAQQGRREKAYSNARLALQRMRVDVHCASGAAVTQNAFGGFTLTLTEANNPANSNPGPAGWCPGVIPAGSPSSGVQWCTIPYTGSTTRWQLFRFLGTSPTDCNGGAGSTFTVDYLAATPGIWPVHAGVDTTPVALGGTFDTTQGWAGNLWPTPSPCQPGRLDTVAIDFNVAVDPVGHPNEHYELTDAIALRNANRCA